MNRMAILQAYYFFGSLYHGGMWTKQYRYMGRAIACGLKLLPQNYRDLSDEAKDLYRHLVQDEMKDRRRRQRLRINGGKGTNDAKRFRTDKPRTTTGKML